MQFILKIRCNYHCLNTHLFFQGSQLMASVASITWLRKRGIGAVNHIGASSIWSWGIIFTLHWGQDKLGQCRAGRFWIIINDNWSISTKWTIRKFFLAERTKSHFVQHQIGTQINQIHLANFKSATSRG